MTTTVYEDRTFAEVVEIVERIQLHDFEFMAKTFGKFACVRIESFAVLGVTLDSLTFKIPNTVETGIESNSFEVDDGYGQYVLVDWDDHFAYSFVPLEDEVYRLEVTIEPESEDVW